MSLKPDSEFPSRRAYVLKLRSAATPQAMVGRIENLVTGRQSEFSSATELFESLASDLRSIEEDGPGGEQR